jgi:hypothetical protein
VKPQGRARSHRIHQTNAGAGTCICKAQRVTRDLPPRHSCSAQKIVNERGHNVLPVVAVTSHPCLHNTDTAADDISPPSKMCFVPQTRLSAAVPVTLCITKREDEQAKEQKNDTHAHTHAQGCSPLGSTATSSRRATACAAGRLPASFSTADCCAALASVEEYASEAADGFKQQRSVHENKETWVLTH